MQRLIAPLVVSGRGTDARRVRSNLLKKTKVYKATFKFGGADGDYASGNYGKVQLVDGKRNDKLSVHVVDCRARRSSSSACSRRRVRAGCPGGD